MITASPMHEAGHPKPMPWDNPEGWRGEGGGRGAQDRGHVCTPGGVHVDVWQKPPQYC